VKAAATDHTGVGSVTIQYKAAASDWHDLCTSRTVPYSCTWDTTKVADGDYQLRATAVDTLGYSGASSILQASVDNSAPTVAAVTVPATITTTAMISATVTDSGSGVQQVQIQSKAPDPSDWSTVCTTTRSGSTYSCNFTPSATIYAAYKFRAVATDMAGNKTISAESASQVDTVTISGTMSDPGSLIGGVKTLTATGVHSNATISSVVFWARTSSAGAWKSLCTAAGSDGSYTCPWNSAGFADGNCDFKVAVTAGGKTQDSAIVSSTLDHVLPAGADVQTESGTAFVLTYTKEIQPGSIVSGWSGSGGKPVNLTLRDGNLLGSGGGADEIQFTDANLGKINLQTDVIKDRMTATLSATIKLGRGTWAGQTVSVVTVAFTDVSNGDFNFHSASKANMVWTPSSAAKGLNTNLAVSANPVTESGTLDKDF
jgi:hypothetical protein